MTDKTIIIIQGKSLTDSIIGKPYHPHHFLDFQSLPKQFEIQFGAIKLKAAKMAITSHKKSALRKALPQNTPVKLYESQAKIIVGMEKKSDALIRINLSLNVNFSDFFIVLLFFII